jgi:tetratricopeptide (TPR) repeat protein
MPKRPARDGGHTAFTDHRIQRRSAEEPAAPLGFRRLMPWTGLGGILGKRNLGLANVTVGERDQSAQHLDEGYRLLSEVYAASPKDPAVLTSLGLLLLRKGNAKEALGLYDSALALEPDFAPYHVNVATAAAEAGEDAKAISHIEQAIALDPSLEQAYRKLGDLHRKRGETARARQALQQYLRFMPGNLAAQAAMDALR